MSRFEIKVTLLLGLTLLLFLVSWNLKPYWAGWNFIAWNIPSLNGNELNKPARIFSGVYSHMMSHEEVQRKKPFNGSELCPICGHNHVFKMGRKTLTETWDAKFKLFWMRCSDCGHGYVWPYLSNKNLSDIYSTNYSRQSAIAKLKLRASSQFEMLQRLHLVTPEIKHMKVLEQGCAHGALLNYFANFSQKLICVDPDVDVNASLITGESRQKMTFIRSTEVSDDIVPDNSIDFWLGSHVMEHFADPYLFISSAFRKLKPGGIFFQEFPFRNLLPAEDYPPDYHLNYFSGKSIQLALIKHGFCQIKLYKLSNHSDQFKGLEFWPDVSKSDLFLRRVHSTMGDFRVVCNKCML